MRNVFLKTVPLFEALELVRSRVSLKRGIEICPLEDSLNRETAEPVYAVLSNPNYNAAAMDGIAVIAEKTQGASETTPVKLYLNQDYIWVNTGHPVKAPYNAVIMVEDVEVLGIENSDADQPPGQLLIRQGAYPWQHVRMVGEDIAIGDMIVPSDKRIGPLDLGALASGGVLALKVYKKFSIAIIPTGTEIVRNPNDMTYGSIMESNSYVFKGLVEAAGHTAVVYPVVKDVKVHLMDAVKKACENQDVVVVNAGSSAGSEDYTREILSELGQVHFHGIDIKPGKPTLFATVNHKPVFGIPGYPVSAYVAFDALVMPLLLEKPIKTYSATLSKPLVSSLKYEEFVRVQVGKMGDRLVATPLSRGAGATMSLLKANGIVRIPRQVEGYEAGLPVHVQGLHGHEPFDNALIAIGSHDIVMDYLEDLAPRTLKILSSHVGSLGGLLALKRGECHIAPCHLLEEDGTYNIGYVRRYFPDKPMVLIKGIKRFQGLYLRRETCEELVEKGLIGPTGQGAFEFDLKVEARELLFHMIKHYRFVNRQRGSGTRLLLDGMLKSWCIDDLQIEGYNLELLTHTAVALGVQSGTADFGLGIAAVADRMNLGFLPLTAEDYDFLAHEDFVESPMGQAFVTLLNSGAFRRSLEEIGGYHFEGVYFEDICSNVED